MTDLEARSPSGGRDWVTQIGEVLTRTALKALYGGSVFTGGVVPSNTSPNVLLFSDPVEGAKYGYKYDGPSADGTAYYYTGRGGAGDQTEIENAAILHHAERGRALRLFDAVGVVPGTQTKRQRYLGEFELDLTEPYRREPAPDKRGEARTVLVFRLLPADEAAALSVKMADEPPAVEPGPTSRAVLVPLEVNSTKFYETGPSEAGTASKDEATLVEALVAHLGGDDFVQRWAITLPSGVGVLLTDPFDPRSKTLYEAKGASTRGNVRMALGQLLDYRRHLPVPGLRCVVLLPERPSGDLCDLIASAGFGLTHMSSEGIVEAF